MALHQSHKHTCTPPRVSVLIKAWSVIRLLKVFPLQVALSIRTWSQLKMASAPWKPGSHVNLTLTSKGVMALIWRACRGPKFDWWLLRWTAVLSNVSSYANARCCRYLIPNKMLMFANYETFYRNHLSPETAVAHHASGRCRGSCTDVYGQTWGSRFPCRTVVSFDFTWRINLQGELFSLTLSSGNEAGSDCGRQFTGFVSLKHKFKPKSKISGSCIGHQAYISAFSMQ